MRTLLPAVLLSSVSLIACGGGGGGDDDVTPVVDGGGGGNTDAAPAACTVSTSNFGDKGALQGLAFINVGEDMANPNDDTLVFQAALEGAEPSDIFFLELYANYGAYMTGTGAVTTGPVQITGAETQYADCGACARVFTNAAGTDYEHDYLATGGTVNITSVGTAVGQTLSGTISNLALTHVNIQDAAPFMSTAAGDNCNTMIMNGTFSAMLEAPPAGPRILPSSTTAMGPQPAVTRMGR